MFNGGEAAIAYIVTRREADGFVVCAKGARAVGYVPVLTAELMAMSAAASEVPSGQTGFIYSDLSDIEKMLRREVSYFERHDDAIRELVEHVERTGLEVRYEPKPGHFYYQECHRAARVVAITHRPLSSTRVVNSTRAINRYRMAQRPSHPRELSAAVALIEAAKSKAK